MIPFNAIIKRNDFYISTPIDDYVLTLTNIDIINIIQNSAKKYVIIVKINENNDKKILSKIEKTSQDVVINNNSKWFKNNLEYQDIITNHYDNVAKDVFNVNQFEWFDKPHWLEMKTECVIRSAYFRATRRYAQWITVEEGNELIKYGHSPNTLNDKGTVGNDNGFGNSVVLEDNSRLDIKGLEFQKSNFPPNIS